MSPNRTPATKRACDGCKIRKIRCGGGHPCPACTNARIKCTYIRVQQPRGPQKLRATTKYLIDQAQQGIDAQEGHPEPAGDAAVRNAADSSEGSRIPINILASPLYIYHVRMYPVWPIVDVESVIARLRQHPDSGETTETYALATAVAAATIAQLRLGHNADSEKSITADAFAAECLRARSSSGYRARVNLNTVRTSFFLHVYYENQHSGGSESLLYLREAISLAQMMHLHRESAYRGLPADEQQIRRRVLWLVFVTERGVCILHKLPVVLKTNISTPELDVNDEPQVLPAFLKLLSLFRLFEQSDMFSIIEDDDPGMQTQTLPAKAQHLDRRFFDLLQDNQQDGSTLLDHISDVQKADLCVTRHWMRMILWRVSARTVGSPYPSSSWWPTSPAFPVSVARDLLNIVSQLPRTAIEAHGLGMELKLYEIANSLADAVMNLAMLPSAPSWDGDSRPSSILARLHSILSTFRGGGNKELVEILYRKMAEAQSRCSPTLYTQVKTRGSRRKVLAESVDDRRHEDTPSSRQQSATSHGAADECLGSHLAPSVGTDCRASNDLISVDTTSDSLGQFFQPLDAGLSAQTFDSVFNAYVQSSWEVEHTTNPSGFPRLSPCLQSNPVDTLLDEFISQVPSDYPDNLFAGDGFMGQSVPVESFPY